MGAPAMTSIRPSPAPLQPTAGSAVGTAADTAKLAAQKAFFEIAMGRAQAPQAAAASAPSVAPAAAAQATAAPARAGEVAAHERYKRPGSILDIRV